MVPLGHRMIVVRSFRRRTVVCVIVAAVSLVAVSFAARYSHAAPQDAIYDLVIANGRVMDPESGLDAQRNVGISDGKIRAISAGALHGKSTIEAQGLVVVPGFIDLHEHGQEPRNYQFQAHDGVTTTLELERGTADVDGWYAQREGKALINYGVSIGHMPVRMRVFGDLGPFLPTGDAAHKQATP